LILRWMALWPHGVLPVLVMHDALSCTNSTQKG